MTAKVPDGHVLFSSGGNRKRDVFEYIDEIHSLYPISDPDDLVHFQFLEDQTFAPTGERGVTVIIVKNGVWVDFLRRKDGWIQVSGSGGIGGVFKE
ncbi:MAG: hypothetical protein ABR527_05730 [Gemmatimonadota bacterium]